MRWIALRWIATGPWILLVIAGLAAPAPAQVVGTPLRQPTQDRQTGRDEEQVRQWYRDYLGREVGPELKAWTELLRGGMSPLDVQATILGSDEFYNEKGRSAQN